MTFARFIGLAKNNKRNYEIEHCGEFEDWNMVTCSHGFVSWTNSYAQKVHELM